MELMENALTPKWSSVLLRGLAGIVFGVIALSWPGVTLAALTLIFGAYAFADGVIALIMAVQYKARPHPERCRWLMVVDGLLGIGVGIATLLWPGLTLLAHILHMGARFTVAGGFQVATAIVMHRAITSPWLYGLAGVASMLLGILTFLLPGLSALVLETMLGIYALVFGVTMLVLSLRLRSASHRVPVHAPSPA
jgi:uncharacterized membrane protein HdeD (DUF308 family)